MNIKLYTFFTCLFLLFHVSNATQGHKTFAPYLDLSSLSNLNVTQWILDNHVQFLVLSLNANNTKQWKSSESIKEIIQTLRHSGGDAILSVDIPQNVSLDSDFIQVVNNTLSNAFFNFTWIDFKLPSNLNDSQKIEQVDWISDIATAHPSNYISVSLTANSNGLSLYSLDFLTRLLEKYSPKMLNLCDLQGSIQDIMDLASSTFQQMDELQIPVSLGLSAGNMLKDLSESNTTQLFDFIKDSPWISLFSMEFMNSESLNERQEESSDYFPLPLTFFNQLNTVLNPNVTVSIHERGEPVISLPVPSTTRLESTTKPTYSPSTLWQTNLYLPYFNTNEFPPPNLVQLAYESTIKHYIMSFISANEDNEPSWNGKISMENNFYLSEIRSLRNIQGDVAISFGGPNLIELASVVKNVDELASKYQSVINRYNVTWLDFYLCSDSSDGIDQRNQAVNILKEKNVGLKISYSLPSTSKGLTQDSVNILTSAARFGTQLDLVNIIAAKYDDIRPALYNQTMGALTIASAVSALKQVQYSGLSFVAIGIVNFIETGSNQQFTKISFDDAQRLVNFALENPYIKLLSIWSINEDKFISSNDPKQELYTYSKILTTYESYNVLLGSGQFFMFFPVIEPTVACIPPPKTTTTSTTVAKPIPTSNTPPSGIGRDRIFAPYVNVWNNPDGTIQKTMTSVGTVFYTIAFLVGDGSGNPAFDGTIPLSTNFLMNTIKTLRSRGGDVIFSFGGASGVEISVSNVNVPTLQQKYQSVITQYGLNWMDFDVEMSTLDNTAANERRNQAIAGLQKANPNLKISFTLPVAPGGLLGNALSLLRSAKSNGVRVDIVNIMTMDYSSGVNGATGMGAASIGSAKNTYSQLQSMGLTSTKVGITPMIGQNDVVTEIFRVEDAQQVLAFAKANSWVNWIAFWSLQRDNAFKSSNLDTSTNYAQQDLAFSKVFQQF